MTETNQTLQEDEVEALSAIYGIEFHVEDKEYQTYSVDIAEGKLKSVLQVSFPEDYPGEAPPTYMLSAPWLKGEKRRELYSYLDEIFLENVGESIVYLWVERVREFMIDYQQISEVNDEETVHSLLAGLTVETQKSNNVKYPEIISGSTLADRKSIFQPHLAIISSVEQVKLVLEKLYENRKIATATHNMFAYRIRPANSQVLIQESEDDGETHAGSRILFLLQVLDVENVLVIVSRWYGGVHLGPDRFKHISNCTRQIIEACGMIKTQSKSTKKLKKK